MTEQETLRLDTLPVSEKKTTIDAAAANADTLLLIDDAEISQKVNNNYDDIKKKTHFIFK